MKKILIVLASFLILVAPCSDDCPDDWIADGMCDDSCNNAECDYDGGDCAACEEGQWEESELGEDDEL